MSGFTVSIRFTRQDGVSTFAIAQPGRALVIGRDTSCDVRLDGRRVSRRHCHIDHREDGALMMVDAGSHNGTYVNGVRIEESVLRHGDVVNAGEWEGRIEVRAARPIVSDDQFAENTSDAIPILAAEATPELTAPSAVRMTFSGGPGVGDPGQRKPSTTRLVLPDHLRGDVRSGEVRVEKVAWNNDRLPSQNEIRGARLDENPLVRRMRETSTQLDFRGLSDLSIDASGGIGAPSPTSAAVDAIALRLVLRVTEALQGATNLDDFLREMSTSLQQAARARAVVVLLPGVDEQGQPAMLPRVIQQRRDDDRVQLSRTIIDHAVRNRMAVASEDAAADERFARGDSVLRFDLKAVLCVPLVRDDGKDVIGALYLTRDLPFSNTERDAVAGLAHMITMSLERSKLREQVAHAERQRSSLERFHAPDVVRRLMMDQGADGPVRDGLFLEPLTATVLFCDLSGFTTFCEHHEPEQVGTLLNSYLATMSEIVFAHGGTVDKFIGDAVMCIFGAPFSAADDAIRAVRCAQAMRDQFRSLVRTGALGEDARNLDVHIGINTGPLMAGTVGSSRRMEYTALGDTVNTASRLEGFAQKGQIVMGPETARAVAGEFVVLPLGRVSLKGKVQAIELFELPELADGKPASRMTVEF
jgi:adenylate cyclase